jgi:rhamnosyltransferase
MRTSIIIPVLRPGRLLRDLLHTLEKQTARPDEVLVVETGADDQNAREVIARGWTYRSVDPDGFDHGGTRSEAALQASGDVLVFFSQDVLPAGPDTLATLLEAFSQQPDVAACYGRQLPSEDAHPFERVKREFLYPAGSQSRGLVDRGELGFRTAQMSNAFAAYRRSDLAAVGWFGERRIMCEDVAVAARLLLEGRRIRYVAESMVVHAHRAGFSDELRRYFDIGSAHANDRWIVEAFGQPGRDGRRYIGFGSRRLREMGHGRLIPTFLAQGIAKRAAFALGRRHGWLPASMRPLCSSLPNWWRSARE